jgi:hypothetical protein
LSSPHGLRERIRVKIQSRSRSRSFATLSQYNAFMRGQEKAKSRYVLGTLSDPSFIRVVKKLKSDFLLENFVETGTYEGETSFFFSGIFGKVFTCDVLDWPKRMHFYFKDNIKYEVLDSPKFLKKHLPEIIENSLFLLDAHWWKTSPLSDELRLVFSNCRNPVIIIDDFDGGQGLGYDTINGRKLDFEYISEFVPASFRFFVNSSSNRNRGMIFLFPPMVDYGCDFSARTAYDSKKHSLW